MALSFQKILNFTIGKINDFKARHNFCHSKKYLCKANKRAYKGSVELERFFDCVGKQKQRI